MSCPDEVVNIVLEIRRESGLRQREAGSAEDSDLWLAEFNHLCKVSNLCHHFKKQNLGNRLKNYLEYAQGPYVFELQSRGLSYSVYEPLWEQLAWYVQQQHAT